MKAMPRICAATVAAVLMNSAPAQAQTPAPTLEYYHVDAIGSVRVVTNAEGQVVRSHDYHPFGEGVGTEVRRQDFQRRYAIELILPDFVNRSHPATA